MRRSFLFAVRTGHWETEKVEQKTQENKFFPNARARMSTMRGKFFCGAFTPEKAKTAEKFGRRRFFIFGGFFFCKKGGEDMKNIFKKALSFFLAVIMTVGMFPVTVMAEEQYVYFSISLDDKFLEGSDGTVMAHVPVAISEL